jgi:hypothetical protein
MLNAVLKGELAIALNPNASMTQQALGFVKGRAGSPKDALSHIGRAIYLAAIVKFNGRSLAVQIS